MITMDIYIHIYVCVYAFGIIEVSCVISKVDQFPRYEFERKWVEKHV